MTGTTPVKTITFPAVSAAGEPLVGYYVSAVYAMLPAADLREAVSITVATPVARVVVAGGMEVDVPVKAVQDIPSQLLLRPQP